MHRSLVLIICMLLFFVSPASAGNYRNISAEELKHMLDAKREVVVVDARPQQEYAEGHISQAINIPPEKFKTIAKLLPKDKKALIVFYCRGAG